MQIMLLSIIYFQLIFQRNYNYMHFLINYILSYMLYMIMLMYMMHIPLDNQHKFIKFFLKLNLLNRINLLHIMKNMRFRLIRTKYYNLYMQFKKNM